MLARHPSLVAAVFLHCVGTDARGEDVLVPRDYAVGAERSVHHFRTYAGAASKAVQAGLLDEDALRRVVNAAFRDLATAGVTVGSDTRNKLRDLRRDVERAENDLALHLMPS